MEDAQIAEQVSDFVRIFAMGSGFPVHAGRVIQVYMEKGNDKPCIKVHEPPKWTAYLSEM